MTRRISGISRVRRLWRRGHCRRMGVMSTRARPQAVWRGIRCRIFRTSGGFRSHFRLAEAHLSRRVLTSTFRSRPVGNRSRKRRAPAAGRGKAGPGTPGFFPWPWADELLQGFSFFRRNAHTEEHPPGRHVSSTPPRYSCDRSQLALCDSSRAAGGTLDVWGECCDFKSVSLPGSLPVGTIRDLYAAAGPNTP